MLTNISIYIVDVLCAVGHPLLCSPLLSLSLSSRIRCKLRLTINFQNERSDEEDEGVVVVTGGDGLKWGIKISDRTKKKDREKQARERERENTHRAQKMSIKIESKGKNCTTLKCKSTNEFPFYMAYSINSRAFYFAILLLRLFLSLSFNHHLFSFFFVPHLPSRYKYVNMSREKCEEKEKNNAKREFQNRVRISSRVLATWEPLLFLFFWNSFLNTGFCRTLHTHMKVCAMCKCIQYYNANSNNNINCLMYHIKPWKRFSFVYLSIWYLEKFSTNHLETLRTCWTLKSRILKTIFPQVSLGQKRIRSWADTLWCNSVMGFLFPCSHDPPKVYKKALM